MYRLAVIPSDPIEAYEKAGYQRLEQYYNPQKMFAEVHVLSPFETADRQQHGMTIRRVRRKTFRDALLELRPHVVRAYGGHWPAELACRSRIPGVPVVVSVHDSRAAMLGRWVRYADLVICVSGAVEKAVLARGAQPSRIRRLPNRIDTTVFRPISDAAELAGVADRFSPGRHILQVGRKSEEKNLDTLIRALRLLPGEYTAVFVGQGNVEPYIRLAEAEGVAERCFWIDSVANKELPRWYSWCDCLCGVSRCEGFGTVFIEAAACGTPIVTSNIAPMNEYLTHGLSAHLVEEYENPQALAQAIRQVCQRQHYRCRLAQGAIEAARPFSHHRLEALEVEIYQEALNLQPRTLTAAERFSSRLDRLLDLVSGIGAWPARVSRRLGRIKKH